MTVALSLYMPTFACDLTRRRRRLDPRGRCAVVLSVRDHQREMVAACCAAALRAGVRTGMTVAHARALLPPDATHLEPFDADSTGRALRRLAAWAVRFVPSVAVDAPDGLLLDATGCERLYGGIGPLAERVVASVRALGVSARLGVAPTWGAAWGLARYSPEPFGVVTIPDGSPIADALAGLPVAALRIDARTEELLGQVGVERIDQLIALPRTALAARYGPVLAKRLDQALGHTPEAIVPVRVREAVREEMEFDGPTDRLEAVEAAARLLLARVVNELARRERGSRCLTLRLDRSDLSPVVLAVRTARPTRDVRHLWALLRPKVEGAHLGFGVQGVGMVVRASARMPHEQMAQWTSEPDGTDAAELARLVDTLTAHLGPRSVLRAEPVESHAPERSVRFVPVSDVNTLTRTRAQQNDADRPSLLFDPPRHAEVVLFMPDGPLAGVRSCGRHYRVVTSIGPERIEPEWWRGGGNAELGAGVRDYFKAGTDEGRWLWLYRNRNGRWWLHGEWA